MQEAQVGSIQLSEFGLVLIPEATGCFLFFWCHGTSFSTDHTLGFSLGLNPISPGCGPGNPRASPWERYKACV